MTDYARSAPRAGASTAVQPDSPPPSFAARGAVALAAPRSSRESLAPTPPRSAEHHPSRGRRRLAPARRCGGDRQPLATLGRSVSASEETRCCRLRARSGANSRPPATPCASRAASAAHGRPPRRSRHLLDPRAARALCSPPSDAHRAASGTPSRRRAARRRCQRDSQPPPSARRSADPRRQRDRSGTLSRSAPRGRGRARRDTRAPSPSATSGLCPVRRGAWAPLDARRRRRAHVLVALHARRTPRGERRRATTGGATTPVLRGCWICVTTCCSDRRRSPPDWESTLRAVAHARDAPARRWCRGVKPRAIAGGSLRGHDSAADTSSPAAKRPTVGAATRARRRRPTNCRARVRRPTTCAQNPAQHFDDVVKALRDAGAPWTPPTADSSTPRCSRRPR